MTIVVTGTDTGIGKTIFAAALAGALRGHYGKPIQSGIEEASDSATVAALSGLAPERILPEAYRLSAPRSPHLAAELDGVTVDPDRLTPPDLDPLVVEGAGGLLVPVTRDLLYADLFARWGHRIVLVARTGLGTINHSLLSIEALRARRIPIFGVAFVGEANEDNEAIVATLGGVKRLGRLPHLDPLDPGSLAAAFAAHFDLADFR